MTHLLLYGNAYVQIIRNGKGEVITLYPIMVNRMSVDRDDKGHDEAIHRIQHLEQLIAQNSEQREALTKLMAQGYIDQILYNQETMHSSCRQRHIALTLKQSPSE